MSAASLPVCSLINYHSGGEKDIMKPLFIDDNFLLFRIYKHKHYSSNTWEPYITTSYFQPKEIKVEVEVEVDL